MKWLNTYPALSEALLSYADDRSFSVAFVSESLSADDVLAVRQAARLCDIVVVAVQGKVLHERYSPYLEGAGADIVFVDKDFAELSPVNVQVQNTGDASYFLKVILKILPLVVTVSTARVQDVQALTALSHEYDGLFSLVTQDMTNVAMSAKQRKVRTCVDAVKHAVEAGERDVSALKSLSERTLREQGVIGEVSHQFVSESLSAFGVRISGKGHYFVSVNMAGDVLHDGTKFSAGAHSGSSIDASGRYI